MLPEGAVDFDPSSDTEFTGSWIAWSFPAAATGGLGAALTVMVTEAVEVAPLLSVTFNWNTYIPSVSPETVVIADVLLVIEPEEGPEDFVHW